MTDDLAAFLDAAEARAAELRERDEYDAGEPLDRQAADALDVLVGMVRAVLAPGQRGMPTSCGCPLRDALNDALNDDSWDGHHDRYCEIATWLRAALLGAIPPTPTAEETR